MDIHIREMKPTLFNPLPEESLLDPFQKQFDDTCFKFARGQSAIQEVKALKRILWLSLLGKEPLILDQTSLVQVPDDFQLITERDPSGMVKIYAK